MANQADMKKAMSQAAQTGAATAKKLVEDSTVQARAAVEKTMETANKTAGDLLKFARALLEGKLLSPELLAEATRNQTPWYGYGFMTREQEGVRMFGHAGGAPGMNGDLRIYPDLGVVVVGLANVDPPAADRLVGYYLLRMPM